MSTQSVAVSSIRRSFLVLATEFNGRTFIPVTRTGCLHDDSAVDMQQRYMAALRPFRSRYATLIQGHAASGLVFVAKSARAGIRQFIGNCFTLRPFFRLNLSRISPNFRCVQRRASRNCTPNMRRPNVHHFDGITPISISPETGNS